jgi:DnaK suppressor protein
VTKLGPHRLQALRDALVAKRRQLETEVGRSALYEKGLDEDSTKDLGDQANTAYTREFQFELGNGDRRLLREVLTALRKLDEGGAFGECERCGEPIGDKRLDALPFARYCIECQRRLEREDKAAAG